MLVLCCLRFYSLMIISYLFHPGLCLSELSAMVFPSPGCQTCRKRRVKCDCTRPLCRKCRTGNRKCTWDSDEQTGLHFRSENAFAMGRRRRPPKTDSSPAITLDAGFTSGANGSKIQPALLLPLEMHALYYYAESVSMERDKLGDACYEYSSHVLHYWNLARPGSCLRLALTAYSHAVIGRNRGVRQALGLAQRVYAKAVVEIQKAMSGISSDTIYQMILAMMLMGSYENVMYFSRESTTRLPPDAVGSRFWKKICHEKGAGGLLIVRRERGFAANAELEKAVRQKCLRVIILRGAASAAWFEDGRSWGEEGHELELDSLMVRVLVLRNKSISFLRDMDASDLGAIDEVKSIAMESYTLDYDLALWALRLPQDLEYHTSWTLSQPTSNVIGARVDIPSHQYTSVGHASTWNRYRALRLITNSIQKRAICALQPLFNDIFLNTDIQRCQDNIDKLAVDICCGTEFSITRQSTTRGPEASTLLNVPHPSVAALLAWPLTVAVSVDAVRLPEKTWLKGVLKAVARSLGHTQLESVSDEGEYNI
ncbi:hypothetical protein TGAM01_v205773 [Trichoderma gamsii]|uniref:Zn(2)-C6 fungal-type domain-containing protein n=1 Tax=Trichoderma gamsii TaxID=398673 RepID=A0A2P4ZMF1_9HYPO|nr:hypothetical protein TGAM01_v205773 [Trichoderma gamsii]PON25479.1 hypothetical protein TGAM01_v205773 [Trichoderma gamsii]